MFALGNAGAPISETTPSAWKTTIARDDLDLFSVIGSLFPGDAEFTSAVADAMEQILSSGDIHRWADLKRFDAHAAKHQRILPDHLLNMTYLLMNRVCSLEGPKYCRLYKEILLDRMDNFHNQCRDEIPQSVSRDRAKYEYLYPYNVKSYGSILQLLGTFLLKADEEVMTDVGKRVASHHNHWFHVGHIVEFLKSLIDAIDGSVGVRSFNRGLDGPTRSSGSPQLCVEMWSALGGFIFQLISGFHGIALRDHRCHRSIADQSGAVANSDEGWIGSVLINVLVVSARRGFASPAISDSVNNAIVASALNSLSTLVCALSVTTSGTLPPVQSVMTQIVDILQSPNPLEDAVACELLNFLICSISVCVEAGKGQQTDKLPWPQSVETVTIFLFKQFMGPTVFACMSERLKTLLLKWIKILLLGPFSHRATLYVWRSVMSMDSPVADFVTNCLVPSKASATVAPTSAGTTTEYTKESAITCFNAIEVWRILLLRDAVFVSHTSAGSGSVLIQSALDLLTTERIVGSGSKKFRTCALSLIANKAFGLRKCRKAVAYILHQCAVRSPESLRRIVFDVSLGESALDSNSIKLEDPTTVSSNIARMILDSSFEEEMDLFFHVESFAWEEIDYEAIANDECRCLDNYSNKSLIGINSLDETKFYYFLEFLVQHCSNEDCPKVVSNRLDHWLVPELYLCGVDLTDDRLIKDMPIVVYHTLSARFMAIALLYESSGVLGSHLLGLLDTSAGVINNDLISELVAIDALFLMLNSYPENFNNTPVNNEYYYGCRVIANLLDDPVNRLVVLKFIQYRWTNRFSILSQILNAETINVPIVGQVESLFKIIAIELLAANESSDSEAQHLVNMREFGISFIASDLSRGSFRLMEFVSNAFAGCKVGECSIVPNKLTNFQIPELMYGQFESNNMVLAFNALYALFESFTTLIVEWSVKVANKDDKHAVLQSLIESSLMVNQKADELFVHCYYAILVPKLLLLLDYGENHRPLAFSLRLVTQLLDAYYAHTQNILTQTGIIQSLCFAITCFVGTAEVWMIDTNKTLLTKIIDALFHYIFVALSNEASVGLHPSSGYGVITFSLTTLIAFTSTLRESNSPGRYAAADTLNDAIANKYRLQYDKKIKDGKEIGTLLRDLQELVRNDILYRELGI